MGKKKTLKQKKLTDMRKQHSHEDAPHAQSPMQTLSYSFSPATKHHQVPTAEKTVVTDLRKTAFISLSIVALEILLFILLQNHVLALPFVRY